MPARAEQLMVAQPLADRSKCLLNGNEYCVLFTAEHAEHFMDLFTEQKSSTLRIKPRMAATLVRSGVFIYHRLNDYRVVNRDQNGVWWRIPVAIDSLVGNVITIKTAYNETNRFFIETAARAMAKGWRMDDESVEGTSA
jgi:hypothetical protein